MIPEWIEYQMACARSDEYSDQVDLDRLFRALTIAWEALDSISRNSCCDKCQEAVLWSKEALTRIERLGGRQPPREILYDGHCQHGIAFGKCDKDHGGKNEYRETGV